MDISTLIGLIVGLGGILAGNVLEGGHFGSLFQGTAAIIVFGGTFGATMVANRITDIQLAISQLKEAFSGDQEEDGSKVAEQILEISQKARRESLLAVDKEIGRMPSGFMRTAFRYVVDGVSPGVIRDQLEDRVHQAEQSLMRGVKVWSDAGGYAPTIGIIGAVLGLIHVMGNLTDTSELGKGIAVAFVATIYGVASANLIFLPIANKIKRNISERMRVNEMIIEGAVLIAEGQSPYLVRDRLRSFYEFSSPTLSYDTVGSGETEGGKEPSS